MSSLTYKKKMYIPSISVKFILIIFIDVNMPNDVTQIIYSHESNMQNDQSETDTLTIHHAIKK
jgi:hypothetical protein